MTVQFPNSTIAIVEIEEDELGQIAKKRIRFSFNELDYIFEFSPISDDLEEGATLTYVGDEERGRLSPSQYADQMAWDVAKGKMRI